MSSVKSKKGDTFQDGESSTILDFRNSSETQPRNHFNQKQRSDTYIRKFSNQDVGGLNEDIEYNELNSQTFQLAEDNFNVVSLQSRAAEKRDSIGTKDSNQIRSNSQAARKPNPTLSSAQSPQKKMTSSSKKRVKKRIIKLPSDVKNETASVQSNSMSGVDNQPKILIQLNDVKTDNDNGYEGADTSICESRLQTPKNFTEDETSPMAKSSFGFQLKLHEMSSVNKDSMNVYQDDKSSVGIFQSPTGLSRQFQMQLALIGGPNPLLPKSKQYNMRTPTCPIKSIKFRLLRDFKTFAEDQNNEQLGQNFHLTNQKHFGRPKDTNNYGPDSSLAVSIENSRLIPGIIYLRDSAILDMLDKKIDQLNQKDVFQHENYLDVKQLVKEREILEKYENGDVESPIMRARKRMNNTGMNQNDHSSCFQYQLKSANDLTLRFESRFESGNLFLAQKVSDVEYNCLMQNDINTKGHTQWFYFRVQNTRKGHSVKFNIMNHNKSDAMFNYGMKVSVYSDKKADDEKIGWHRDCTDISYFQNNIRRDSNTYAKYYYTASFTYTFEYDEDNVFFSYFQPYTFSDLQNDLNQIQTDSERSKFFQIGTLCKTIAGVDCPLVTITSRSQSAQAQNDSKKAVIVTARVHPGETVGSWMMRGLMFFLTDPDNEEAKLLRDNFIFKIVPMLNPDGVVNGNYRCSLAGCDLNRRWKFPNKLLHPTIYATKKLVKNIQAERQIILFCDMHGHSRKQNIFMYGCNQKLEPEKCRILPYILGKLSPLFDFESSNFGIQKTKEATARITIFKELKNCPQVFTLESTFAGLDKGPHAGQHISTGMLESMGKDLCRALLIQQNIHVPQQLLELVQHLKGFKHKTFSEETAKEQNFNPVAYQLHQSLLNEIRQNKSLLKVGDGDSTSGSDSEPSEDNLEPMQLIKNLPTIDKALSVALKQAQQIQPPTMKKLLDQQPCLMKRSVSPKKTERVVMQKETQVSQSVQVQPSVGKRKIVNQKLAEIKEEQKDFDSPPQRPAKKQMVDAFTQTDPRQNQAISSKVRDRLTMARESNSFQDPAYQKQAIIIAAKQVNLFSNGSVPVNYTHMQQIQPHVINATIEKIVTPLRHAKYDQFVSQNTEYVPRSKLEQQMYQDARLQRAQKTPLDNNSQKVSSAVVSNQPQPMDQFNLRNLPSDLRNPVKSSTNKNQVKANDLYKTHILTQINQQTIYNNTPQSYSEQKNKPRNMTGTTSDPFEIFQNHQQQQRVNSQMQNYRQVLTTDPFLPHKLAHLNHTGSSSQQRNQKNNQQVRSTMGETQLIQNTVDKRNLPILQYQQSQGQIVSRSDPKMNMTQQTPNGAQVITNFLNAIKQDQTRANIIKKDVSPNIPMQQKNRVAVMSPNPYKGKLAETSASPSKKGPYL